MLVGNKIDKGMSSIREVYLKIKPIVCVIEFDRWICYSYSLIRLFGVFGGGLLPIKTTLLQHPTMQNAAPLVIVVSLGE